MCTVKVYRRVPSAPWGIGQALLKKHGLSLRQKDSEKQWRAGWDQRWFSGSAECAVASSDRISCCWYAAKKQIQSGWCGSMNWASSHGPRGSQFDSRSEYMLRLWAWFLGGMQEAYLKQNKNNLSQGLTFQGVNFLSKGFSFFSAAFWAFYCSLAPPWGGELWKVVGAGS